MSYFGWKIDLRREVSAKVRKKCEGAVTDLLNYLLETANRTVPIEEHTLEESGGTSQEGLNGTVYYDEIYGPRQHEEMEWHHDPGRRAKWLELTIKEEEDRAHKILAEKAKF